MRAIAYLLATLLLAGCGTSTPAQIPADLPPSVAVRSELIGEAGAPPAPGEMAPDFRYTMPDGTVRTLAELRGRKVLVNFWATWCAPCKEEMPDLQRIADEYGETVQVVGVNKLEALEAIGPFANDLDVRFTLVANPEGDISDGYAARNLPLTYFINSDGTIGHVQIGVITYDEAKSQVDRLR
jgi:thiol-disulfide isomerase/thioredoxin